ncbi:uncharacterized mitochondrial protein AtMg00820-like [Lathyrus oleraceus]|uniref:uncharacterized mitochondrial protein AtMg00820-like n=1 Tax=Pisum sativum TaxID=3888 RepID=UPI0021D16FF6|nr:uncharacterized mitochondrial protein AtMg00820-like [Pisum sativum]
MPAGLQECVITLDDMVDDKDELVHYVFYVDVEPVNAVEALKDSNWIKAMNEEWKSIEVNSTWSLVELLKCNKEIDLKWVYKMKLNSKGEVTQHKARLVAKGFLRKEGIDFDENDPLGEEVYVSQLFGFVKQGEESKEVARRRLKT